MTMGAVILRHALTYDDWELSLHMCSLPFSALECQTDHKAISLFGRSVHNLVNVSIFSNFPANSCLDIMPSDSSVDISMAQHVQARVGAEGLSSVRRQGRKQCSSWHVHTAQQQR